MELLAIGLSLIAIHVGAALGYFAWAYSKALSYKPARGDPPSGYPSVSVIIPTYMEADKIEGKLNDIASQGYRGPLEIIVVDDNSPDGTADRAEAWARERPVVEVRVIRRRSREGKHVAEAEAARSARGEIVVFTDADCTWSPGALEAVAGTFSDPRVGLVTCVKRPLGGNSISRRVESSYRDLNNVLRLGESASHSTPIAHGELLAVRRDLLLKLGGPRPGSDDSDLAHRTAVSGLRAVAIPNATCFEAVPRGLDAVLWKLRRGQHLVLHFARAIRDLRRAPPGYRLPLVMEFYLHLVSPWLAVLGASLLIAAAAAGSIVAAALLAVIASIAAAYGGARAWAYTQLLLIAAQVRDLWTRETVWRKLNR